MKYLMILILTGCAHLTDRCTSLIGEEKLMCINTQEVERIQYERLLKEQNESSTNHL